MTLVITDDQIADRDAWEQKLKLGKCTLQEALLMVLHSGAPDSAYLVECTELAFIGYLNGTYKDLAIPFGCAESQREKNRLLHETTRSDVKFHVKSFRRQGYPMLNPDSYPDKVSAFTKTADLLQNVSASYAFDIHYDRDIKKRKSHR